MKGESTVIEMTGQLTHAIYGDLFAWKVNLICFLTYSLVCLCLDSGADTDYSGRIIGPFCFCSLSFILVCVSSHMLTALRWALLVWHV